VCTNDECGGPAYCVHRYAPTLQLQAVLDWRVYDLKHPWNTSVQALALAQECVVTMLDHHIAPSDMYRCGATPSVLAMLGVTLSDLVSLCGYAIDDVISGLRLDWSALQALNFHVGLLRLRHYYPVHLLYNCGMTKERFLEFRLSYTDIAALGMTPEELFILGCTAVDLIHLGLTLLDLLDLVSQAAQRGGAFFVVEAFRLTPELFARISRDAHRKDLTGAAYDTYTKVAQATLDKYKD